MNFDKLREIALHSCRLSPDAPVLVGVSGGPDSLCLLDALARLGYRLIVAHFDHRLRPESGSDAEVVRQSAEILGFPFVLGGADVAEYASRERLSLEDAARELRYRFLFAQARRRSAQAVAVGHNADDQVETVLMHLLRGAGLNGLRGMPFRAELPEWDPEIPLVRPLLAFWRDEILRYCQRRGLQPVTDSSNQDLTFFRNRLRHQLLPLLDELQPNARRNIYRSAQVLAGDQAVIEAAVQRAWEGCLLESGPGFVALRLPCLQELPLGVQRGVLRRAVAELLPALRDVDFAAVERAVQFVRSPGPGQVDLVRGLRLFVERDRLLVTGTDDLPPARDWPQVETEEILFHPPGEVHLGSGWRLAAQWVPAEHQPLFSNEAGSEWKAWLDAETLPGELKVRRPRPGDRFQPLGMAGHSVKLSDFWVNEKLPRRARAGWPLVTAGEEIIWVPGFRPAHGFRVTESTQTMLYLWLTRETE